MSTKLSLRARAALHYFVNSDMSISADRLADVVVENRKAIQTALKELREAGLILTRKERVGNRVVTVSYVTEKGFLEANSWGSQNVLQIQHTVQNSSIQVLAYSANNINKTSIEGLEEKMGYDFFEPTSSSEADERQAERLKAIEERKASYKEKKEEEHEKKVIDRETTSPDGWNINQSINEFATQMSQIWGIPPWNMAGSRFFIALAKSRTQYDTNGSIEQEMMRIFFGALKINKETNGDMLWKMFIKRFPDLAVQAKSRINSSVDLDTAMVQAEEQWKKEFGEDFSV
jgi:hypothetical protein